MGGNARTHTHGRGADHRVSAAYIMLKKHDRASDESIPFSCHAPRMLRTGLATSKSGRFAGLYGIGRLPKHSGAERKASGLALRTQIEEVAGTVLCDDA
jgi:hypothetical protein